MSIASGRMAPAGAGERPAGRGKCPSGPHHRPPAARPGIYPGPDPARAQFRQAERVDLPVPARKTGNRAESDCHRQRRDAAGQGPDHFRPESRHRQVGLRDLRKGLRKRRPAAVESEPSAVTVIKNPFGRFLQAPGRVRPGLRFLESVKRVIPRCGQKTVNIQVILNGAWQRKASRRLPKRDAARPSP